MGERSRNSGAPPPLESVARPASPPLAPFVRAVWALRGAPPGPFERILPQPVAHVIVNLSEPYRLLRIGGEVVDEPFEDAFVSALQRRYLLIQNPRELWQCGAELAPWGLRAFTSARAVDLAGRVRSAATVIDGSDGWRARLRGLESPQDALDAFEELLRSRLRPEVVVDPIAVAGSDRLDADPDLPIASLAVELEVSPGRLVAAFRRACGVTPKEYADLVRFHRFVTSIPFEQRRPRWSDLVAQTGYYDQPHFIRTFRSFTGFTPSEYLAGVREHGSEFALFIPMREP